MSFSLMLVSERWFGESVHEEGSASQLERQVIFGTRAKAALRTLASLACALMPPTLKVVVYRTVFGYKIGDRVRIGFSWINVERLEIGDDVRIGHLNRFKNIPRVTIGDCVCIGVGNTFTSAPEFTCALGRKARRNDPSLTIGKHAQITMFHYFDVQDSLTIGAFTVVAGRGSVFFTHYLDVATSSQACKPIHIGAYCMLGSCVRFAPGAVIGDCCVVGIGAVVTRKFSESYRFIGGNPADVIKQLPHDAAYFSRTTGWIGAYSRSPFEEKVGPECE